jgi:flagellar FliJ protein
MLRHSEHTENPLANAVSVTASSERGEAFEELKKVEMLDERNNQAREKAEANAREQTELDRTTALRFGAGGAHA